MTRHGMHVGYDDSGFRINKTRVGLNHAADATAPKPTDAPPKALGRASRKVTTETRIILAAHRGPLETGTRCLIIAISYERLLGQIENQQRNYC